MQFMQLRGLSRLPVELIAGQFRNEDVRAVLPVIVSTSTAEGLLVATAAALAIVITDPGGTDGRWMTRWAPWDTVRLSDGTNPWTDQSDDEYQLFIDVGRVRFESHLEGEQGRKTLRDFVAAVTTRSSGMTAAPRD